MYLPDRAPERQRNRRHAQADSAQDLVEAWRDLEDHAKDLAKRLIGQGSRDAVAHLEAALRSARPEMILFLAVTARQQAVAQKIKNFFTKWRQVQQKIPLPEMTELHITPQLPEYPKIAQDVFMLLLDGKLRSRTETLKFLKPLAPPPPPPPPPPPAKRGRAAKAAAAAAATATPAAEGGKKKGKGAAPAPAPPLAPAKVEVKGKPDGKAKPETKGKPVVPPKASPKKASPPKPAPKQPAPKASKAAKPAKKKH